MCDTTYHSSLAPTINPFRGSFSLFHSLPPPLSLALLSRSLFIHLLAHSFIFITAPFSKSPSTTINELGSRAAKDEHTSTRNGQVYEGSSERELDRYLWGKSAHGNLRIRGNQSVHTYATASFFRRRYNPSSRSCKIPYFTVPESYRHTDASIAIM